MAMFKMKNCHDMTLIDNETSSTEFLDAENTTNVFAKGNKAGVDFTKSELVEKLELIISSLKKEDVDTVLTSNMEDLVDELREEQPTQSRVKKWLGRVSGAVQTAKVSAELLNDVKEVIPYIETFVQNLNQ
ncbi:hypothetical protein JC606_00320 [Vibrio sp. IB15]|uniref:hypothetical protein n=1 Tax=Vibrio sp. IB15 TaxID=2779368 RepID=UPI0018E80305|nr:hypothetical protein [Vibrio sp. IB15]MBJ2144832.1 hypothetical protein [Vibrio sp. IB15]